MTLFADTLHRWWPPFVEVGPPYWDDRPVVIVGAGASLAGFDFGRIRGRGDIYVLAVKSAWRDIQHFEGAICGMDLPWMKREQADLTVAAARWPLYLALEDREYLTDVTPRIAGARYVKQNRKQDGRLSDDPRVLECGGNSGFTAFNLAYLKRARHIVLLGFDFGGGHYAPDRYAHNPPGHNERYLPRWGRIFDDTRMQIEAAGIEVVNASLRSNLTAFPRMSIDAALLHLDRIRSARV